MPPRNAPAVNLIPVREATSHPLLITSRSVDLAAAEAALPGYDLRWLDGISPGEADDALLCLTVPADAPGLSEALAAAGLAHLPIVTWTGDAAGLVEAMARQLGAVLADAGAARRAAALLRREDEALNRRFKALEAFAWSLGGPKASLALSWAPGAGAARPASDSVEVRQRLPLDITALAAVEIQLPETDGEAAAAIEVAIEDSEGQRHPLALATPAAQVGGWLRFAAPVPLAVAPQDGTLIVTAVAPDTVFGLGLPVPDPEFSVSGLDDVGNATFALRVWKGIEGTAGQMAPPVATGGDLHHERLMPSALPLPELLARPQDAHDYIKAEYWPDENAFLVHPSINGPVCAVVRKVPAGALMQLSAVVNAMRRDSAVLGFALGYAPSGQATADNWQDFIGEWLFLPPASWGEVHAPISAMTAAPVEHWDLLLASCVAGNRPNDNAWALFRAFRLSTGTRS